MDEWLKVVFQGIVQGVTEFLPISSTGHLLIFSDLLNFQEIDSGTFEIFIQIGTLVAVIAFYRTDLWYQVRSFPNEASVRRLWINVIIASIPLAIIGFLVLDFIENEVFANENLLIFIIAITLIIGGVIFLWVENSRFVETDEATSSLNDVTLNQAVFVGVAQVFALIPGTSRSGATIVGGLLTGLNRKTATEFSFYLAIPALGGATVLKFLFDLNEIDGRGFAFLLVGATVAGVVAWFAIAWLLRYVSRHNFVIFGYYRILAGIVLLVMLAFGWI